MEITTSVEEALELINAHPGGPESFQLCQSDSLLDPVGINMAIITDRILGRGWQPAGFAQKDGCRIFSYQELD